MTFAELTWLWIPITIWAAFAQTVRNAAQRHLTPLLGTLGATLVRFLYGLPFALLWLAFIHEIHGVDVPGFPPEFLLWTVGGGLSQIAGTALLLQVMAERNFAAGVGWTKTEILQVAVFSFVLLREFPSPLALAGIVMATLGVLLLSSTGGERALSAIAKGWASRAALLGVTSGACFALSTVAFRGSALSLGLASAPLAAAWALAAAQTSQVIMLGGWLLLRDPDVVLRTLRAWRSSLLAGFMGAAASVGWFTAMAMQPVTHVRTLGLVELLFSYAVSWRMFRERLGAAEQVGLVLLILGLAAVLNAR
ncbi:MAG: EamA/RhaT family transporter [Alphaproteobacteria bacterium]|nr:EamA/RhaT family transporter [Alphaproteobacteria bacterium]